MVWVTTLMHTELSFRRCSFGLTKRHAHGDDDMFLLLNPHPL